MIGGGGNRANLVGDPNFSGDRSKAEKLLLWFNPAAFAQNPVGTLGTSGKAPFTGPGFQNIDFSLIRSFPIRVGPFAETQRLDFRAEFFNLFNHAQFAVPGGQYFADINSPTFATISSTVNNPRVIQFALKLAF